VAVPGCLYNKYLFRIPGLGVKIAPDPGSATLPGMIRMDP
jgi:hypothetical protein